ncbi:MAG: NADH:ubiquinone oxidoreductase [Nitrospirota bacterium]|nr:NADH:ubiquinone oxidoreductase [Nitrospirota bacterium]
MPVVNTYLSVPIHRPRVAFFEFTACEGCQLQILNKEATLLDFLSLVEVVNFREAMKERSDDYEIAFIEGSITRQDEAERLKDIRARAKTLVAMGSCACFGGVNQLKNRFNDLKRVKKQVYGSFPIETEKARPIEDIVKVDLKIYGCPIKKEEVERIVTNLVLGKSVTHPKYPVCMECMANDNICLYKLGEPCLGPVTRAGCNAWCTGNRCGCWGCRGPADGANVQQIINIMEEHRFSAETILDRLECFGGFAEHADALRKKFMKPEKRKKRARK